MTQILIIVSANYNDPNVHLSACNASPEIEISIGDKSAKVDGGELIQAIAKCMNLEVDVCEEYRH